MARRTADTTTNVDHTANFGNVVLICRLVRPFANFVHEINLCLLVVRAIFRYVITVVHVFTPNVFPQATASVVESCNSGRQVRCRALLVGKRIRYTLNCALDRSNAQSTQFCSTTTGSDVSTNEIRVMTRCPCLNRLIDCLNQ